MRTWDRRKRRHCDACGGWFMASGPQELCDRCKAKVKKEQDDVSLTRRAKPAVVYCECGKPCKEGERYCSYICETIAAIETEKEHGSV